MSIEHVYDRHRKNLLPVVYFSRNSKKPLFKHGPGSSWWDLVEEAENREEREKQQELEKKKREKRRTERNTGSTVNKQKQNRKQNRIPNHASIQATQATQGCCIM